VQNLNKLVVVSGYFNPIHLGHLDMIAYARKIAQQYGRKDHHKLCVIVNNDEQVRLKGSCPFQTEQERIKIVQNIKGVARVVLSVDTDESVAKTLELLKPAVFINGGDRASAETISSKEMRVCDELGIKTVFMGGGKENSSSDLVLRAYRWYMKKHY